MPNLTIKRRAKAMYLDGVPPKKIADELDISYNTVKYWVDRGSGKEVAWKEIKQSDSDERLIEALKDKNTSLEYIYDLGIDAIKRGLINV
jgi:uncharacterized protein YjcR